MTRLEGKALATWLICWTLAGVSVAQSDTADAKNAARVVRVAAVSFVPKKFDLQGNADRLDLLFRKAKQGGAEIAVAPEGALEGYVVNEIIAGEVPAEKMNDVALPIDHPVIQRFQRLAAELEMCLVFGFAERIGEDVFNCAAFVDNQGQIRGKYHKMQFAEGYHPSWWFNRLGQHSRAFDTPYGRCGIMICNDRWNPLLAQIPVLDGAQFLLIPAMGSRSKSQDEAVLNRGKETGVPIVANVGVTLSLTKARSVRSIVMRKGSRSARSRFPPRRRDPTSEIKSSRNSSSGAKRKCNGATRERKRNCAASRSPGVVSSLTTAQ